MRTTVQRLVGGAMAFVICATLLPLPAIAGVGLNTAGSAAGLKNIGGGSIEGFATRIVASVMGLTGVIFMILIIYSGFMWMTAAGNEERVSKAKKIISAAVVGLVVVSLAYYIVDTIFRVYYTYPESAATAGEDELGDPEAVPEEAPAEEE